MITNVGTSLATRWHCRMKPRFFIALLIALSVAASSWATILLEMIAAPTTATDFKGSSVFFPSKKEFQQSFSKSSSISEDEVFFYANESYHYRYSTKLFSKNFSIMRDGADILPTVVFGVCANAAKPVRRQAIRKSWGRNVPVVFLVAGEWDNISQEFSRFGDLLWVDMPEDYRNALTPKTFAFIQFASRNAIPALSLDYMFKTDDDVYINATEMSRELYVHDRPDYYGLLREGTAPIRNKTETGLVSKWYMSKEEYPDDTFPPYAHGTGYALSKRFGDCAIKAMATILPMPWEDVATGILAKVCQVELAPADNEWSHFVPMNSSQSEWTEFPYHRFKNGNVTVKILHKVKPWFFEPLSRQASLIRAREYGGQKLVEFRQRRHDGG